MGPRWLLPAGIAITIGVALLVALARRDGGTGDGARQGGESVAHVHGLGINPADGALYAATHYGLFRVPDDGRAVRVGAVRDLMGFTVAGAGVFLASGHPGGASDPLFDATRRPLLGLIRSTDGGESWQPVSLLGEADFHSLRAAHGRVYGVDSTSGRFMVSTDGATWDVRATMPMGDFAVAPDDPDRIVAVTGDGLAESADGGRTWTATGGPRASLLSWDAGSGLWAAAENGDVSVRTASGWEARHRLPGRPQALTVTGRGAYAAASSEGLTAIYESSDGARSWKVRYADEHP